MKLILAKQIVPAANLLVHAIEHGQWDNALHILYEIKERLRNIELKLHEEVRTAG